MVEPVALAFNSLNARLTHALPGIAAAKLVARPLRPALPADFFNPRPRSVKGKERALDPSLTLNDWPAWQCQEWLCSPHVWCSIHHRAELMEELRPTRGRSRRVPRTIPSPRANSAGRVFVASQKRHVSHSSEALQEDEGRPPDYHPPYETSTHSRRRESWASHLFPAAAAPERRQELSPAVPQVPSPTSHEEAPSSAMEEEQSLSSVTPEYEHSQTPITLDTLFPPYEPEHLRPVKRPRLDPKSLPSPVIALHRLRNLINGPTTDILGEEVQTLLTCLRDGSQLEPHEVLLLSSKMLRKTQAWHDSKQGWNRQRQFGEVLVSILEPLRGRFAPSSIFDYQHHCMLSEALSLCGRLAEAATILRSIDTMHGHSRQNARVLQAHETLVLAANRYYDAARVLDYVVLEGDRLGAHILRRSFGGSSQKALRDTVFGILYKVENPAQILDNRPGWTQEQRAHAAATLLEVCLRHELPQDALEIFEYMEREHIDISLHARSRLIRLLAREGMDAAANRVNDSTPNLERRSRSKVNLFIASHRGDTLVAEGYYRRLIRARAVQPFDTAMYMLSYAVHGAGTQTARLFSQHFAWEGRSWRHHRIRPSYLHYSLVIQAYTRAGDRAAAKRWVEMMRNDGHRPSVDIYAMVLQMHARRGDHKALQRVMRQMERSDIVLTAAPYTSVINLLAKQRDIEGAERIFDRALRHGVKPDRRMLRALMDAYAEGGNWQGLVRAFDFASKSPERQLRLSIELYNQLFKGYLRMGAPFRLVSRLFLRLRELGVRPNQYTYALVMQSAVDAGKMRVADELYGEMKRLGETDPDLRPNEYVVSILLIGALRRRMYARAMQVLREAKEQRIPLRPAAYVALVRMHAYKRTPGGRTHALEFAHDLVRSILDSPNPAMRRALSERPVNGLTVVERFYFPLLRALAKQRRPEAVEELVEEIHARGVRPSIATLTVQLDAYRRTYRLDDATALWQRIFRKGVKIMRPSVLFAGDEGADAKRDTQVLCPALSIYVDALSAAGQHEAIPSVWQACADVGVEFDGHNWNQLAIALLRAGQVTRAFELVEKVLIPMGQRSMSYRTSREPDPETPLAASTAPPMDPPLDRPTRRAYMQRRLKRPARRLFQDVSSGALAKDAAGPMHVLQQVAPAFGSYRPHRALVRLLKLAYHRLRARAPAEVIGPRPTPEPERRIAYERSTYIQSAFLPRLAPEEQIMAKEEAEEVRRQIEARYPGAVALVKQEEVNEKARRRVVGRMVKAKRRLLQREIRRMRRMRTAV
ncbi:hypothetical protein FB107DRAFT_201157 [Schizophyllum commune]